MKRFLVFLVIFSLVFASSISSAEAQQRKRKSTGFSPNKYAALIVDAQTGNIIHQENADRIRYPASLTKMMTLYLTFEAIKKDRLKMNQMVTVSARADAQPPLGMGLRKGQRISIRDAVLSLIVKSANDSSVVLAEAVAGTETQFALLMTNKARKLGMSRTTFQNASGLHSERQRTTAKDLAKLAIALQRDFPEYYPLFSRTSFTFNGRVYVGHNSITRNYRGADGIKTGYIRASGFNLVSSAARDGRRLVGVVMGGNSAVVRDRRMASLLDNSFSRLRAQQNRTRNAESQAQSEINSKKNS